MIAEELPTCITELDIGEHLLCEDPLDLRLDAKRFVSGIALPEAPRVQSAQTMFMEGFWKRLATEVSVRAGMNHALCGAIWHRAWTKGRSAQAGHGWRMVHQGAV